MADDKETSRNVEIDDDLIDEIVSSIAAKMSAGRQARHRDNPRGDDGPDLDGQIRKAVAEASARDKEKSEAQALRDKVKALEERTERKPVEYRGITRLVWGGNE